MSLGKRSFRPTAAVVSLVYAFTNIAFAHQPQSVLWKERRSNQDYQVASLPAALPAISAPFLKGLNPAHLPDTQLKSVPSFSRRVPASFLAHTNIREVFSSPSDTTVVLIEDIHQNIEAQTHISEAIKSFETVPSQSDVLVALEGANGSFLYDLYRQLPDQKLAVEVADSFLKSGDISGPAHAGFTSHLKFWGVDDLEWYSRNLRAYKMTRAIKEPTLTEIEQWQKALSQQKRSQFSRPLSAFDAAVEAHRAGSLSLGAFIRILSEQGHTSLVMDQFLAAYDMERSLNFNRVESERARVIRELVKALNKEDMQSLVDLSAGYQQGIVTFGSYYQVLKSLCQKAGINLARTPAFDDYVRYVLLADGIRAEQLFIDVRAAEERCYTALAQTPQETELVSRSRQLYLSRQLVNFSLTSHEWEDYDQGRASTPELDLKSFEEFYVSAEKRSEAMVNNVLSTKDSVPSTVVLVSGGYHTLGMTRLLKAKGVSYLVATPKLSKIEAGSGSAYLSVFDREKTPLEKIFSGQKLFMVKPPAGSGRSFPGGGASGSEMAANYGAVSQTGGKPGTTDLQMAGASEELRADVGLANDASQMPARSSWRWTRLSPLRTIGNLVVVFYRDNIKNFSLPSPRSFLPTGRRLVFVAVSILIVAVAFSLVPSEGYALMTGSAELAAETKEIVEIMPADQPGLGLGWIATIVSLISSGVLVIAGVRLQKSKGQPENSNEESYIAQFTGFVEELLRDRGTFALGEVWKLVQGRKGVPAIDPLLEDLELPKEIKGKFLAAATSTGAPSTLARMVRQHTRSEILGMLGFEEKYLAQFEYELKIRRLSWERESRYDGDSPVEVLVADLNLKPAEKLIVLAQLQAKGAKKIVDVKALWSKKLLGLPDKTGGAELKALDMKIEHVRKVNGFLSKYDHLKVNFKNPRIWALAVFLDVDIPAEELTQVILANQDFFIETTISYIAGMTKNSLAEKLDGISSASVEKVWDRVQSLGYRYRGDMVYPPLDLTNPSMPIEDVVFLARFKYKDTAGKVLATLLRNDVKDLATLRHRFSSVSQLDGIRGGVAAKLQKVLDGKVTIPKEKPRTTSVVVGVGFGPLEMLFGVGVLIAGLIEKSGGNDKGGSNKQVNQNIRELKDLVDQGIALRDQDVEHRAQVIRQHPSYIAPAQADTLLSILVRGNFRGLNTMHALLGTLIPVIEESTPKERVALTGKQIVQLLNFIQAQWPADAADQPPFAEMLVEPVIAFLTRIMQHGNENFKQVVSDRLGLFANNAGVKESAVMPAIEALRKTLPAARTLVRRADKPVPGSSAEVAVIPGINAAAKFTFPHLMKEGEVEHVVNQPDKTLMVKSKGRVVTVVTVVSGKEVQLERCLLSTDSKFSFSADNTIVIHDIGGRMKQYFSVETGKTATSPGNGPKSMNTNMLGLQDIWEFLVSRAEGVWNYGRVWWLSRQISKTERMLGRNELRSDQTLLNETLADAPKGSWGLASVGLMAKARNSAVPRIFRRIALGMLLAMAAAAPAKASVNTTAEAALEDSLDANRPSVQFVHLGDSPNFDQDAALARVERIANQLEPGMELVVTVPEGEDYADFRAAVKIVLPKKEGVEQLILEAPETVTKPGQDYMDYLAELAVEHENLAKLREFVADQRPDKSVQIRTVTENPANYSTTDLDLAANWEIISNMNGMWVAMDMLLIVKAALLTAKNA